MCKHTEKSISTLTIQCSKEKCNHYENKLMIKGNCCDKWFACRRCHDEQSDHKLQDATIHKIKCKNCNHIQEKSNECEKCGINFAEYYCNECLIWTGQKNGPIYH